MLYVRFIFSVISLISTLSVPRLAAQKVAEPSTPTVQALRLDGNENIHLDGLLNEPIWGRTKPAEGFLQQEPLEGMAATEPTEVHIAYDATTLYLGFIAYDTNPSGIIARQRERDAGLGSDDRIMWVLDTFLDGRTGYFFEINPAGLMGDGLLRVGGYGFGVNKSWDGIWEAQVNRGTFGWSAEVRIPFRTLNFDPGLEAWGINFQRTIRRKNEETLWSGHRPTQGLFRPVHAGRLIGLEDLSQGIGLEMKPYVAATTLWTQNTGTKNPADVGVDFTYSLTPSLRAAVTINTDFAETEVDTRQVNLTRFPLFFPERRQFFLEGASVYAFATSGQVYPYFSRRIGLANGEPISIQFGTRLSGQVGPYELGVMQLKTAKHKDQPSEHFTAARLKRNFFEQSSIGVIYTRRDGGLDNDLSGMLAGQTIGTDLDLSTARFLGDKNLQFEAFYVVHTNPIGKPSSLRDRTSRGVRLNYPNDIWQMHVSWREFGNHWDPAVGFARRRGFRRVNPSIRYAPRPDWGYGIRQLNFGVFFEHLTDLTGQLQTQRTQLTPLGIRFNSGDVVNLQITSTLEHLEQVFQIYPGVIIPTGGYKFTEARAQFRSSPSRKVWGNASLTTGDFWSGHRTQYALSGSVNPQDGLTLSLDWTHNQIELPQGTFTTRLIRVRGNWNASPWQSLLTTVQYDDISKIMGLYSRYRWIVRPGSDIYLVYTHNWQSIDGAFSTLSRGGTTKINYTHRF